MIQKTIFVLFAALCGITKSKPVENLLKSSSVEIQSDLLMPTHSIWRRFIKEPLATAGLTNTVANSRMRRSIEEQCEKLQLCKLHARSRKNFFAAFELYFVNKENARLWDHRAHSMAECERRFGRCYNNYDR